MRSQKVWFITGASRGFGRVWAEAALERGDNVVAAVRDPHTVAGLKTRFGDQMLIVKLNVSLRSDAIVAAEQARQRFGRVDVLVNNAGYCLTGALEEVDEAEARELFDTNVFGALWVTQSVLPMMRVQASGHIIAVSSIGGLIGQPTLGVYNSSKWAIEGMFEALHHEVKDLGIKVSILEPGIYATEFASNASMRHSQPNDAYSQARARLAISLKGEAIGDPRSTIDTLMALVEDQNPTLRVPLGDAALWWAVRSHSNRLASWTLA